MISKIRAIGLLIVYISALILSIILTWMAFAEDLPLFGIVLLMDLTLLVLIIIIGVRREVVEMWKE